MDYADYEHLRFERPEPGVLLITIDRAERYNATHERLHWELSKVWLNVADDEDTRVAVITGEGKAFSAGGDLDMVQRQSGSFTRVAQAMREAGDIVLNITNCEKPVISAINGVAVGAGLAVALMADISIASEKATFSDGHVRIGVAAGDHAAIIWPLLCGLAKARYYLLTADFLDGREADRIGLVSKCVPHEELMSTAMSIAHNLANGPQYAIRWTKGSLNHWVRDAGPIFDASLALEMLGFFGHDLEEGVAALREKRDPQFPSVTAQSS